jgi:hypothetical protein
VEVTRFIAHFAKALATDDVKDELKVRHRVIKRETRLEVTVPQLANVIVMNLTMYRMSARHDRRGMQIQAERLIKARQHLDNTVDAQVEALTELFLRDNASHPIAAEANRSFLDWAVHARTPRNFGLQESA